MRRAIVDRDVTFVKRSAIFLDALANANRLSVLIVLEKGEMSVGPLSVKIQLSQSALSQHLAKLRAAGLVKTRRERQVVFYSCTSEAVHRILENLRTLFGDRDVVDGFQIDEH